jgi:hypothetical protein
VGELETLWNSKLISECYTKIEGELPETTLQYSDFNNKLHDENYRNISNGIYSQ